MGRMGNADLCPKDWTASTWICLTRPCLMSNLLILHVDGQNPAMVNTKIAGIYGCSFRLQMVSIGIDHY